MKEVVYDFSTIISENFIEIRNNFIIGLKNHGYEYNEDILADTFIKCNTTLRDKKLTKKDSIKYFWTAYLNRLRNEYKKTHNKRESLDESVPVMDYQYDDTMDELYDYILNIITEKFGKNIAKAWEEYMCYGKTYKYVVEKYNLSKNFQYYIKKINKLLKTDLIKNDTYYNDLLYYIRTT